MGNRVLGVERETAEKSRPTMSTGQGVFLGQTKVAYINIVKERMHDRVGRRRSVDSHAKTIRCER